MQEDFKNFQDVERYRRTDEAQSLSDEWIKDKRGGLSASEAQMKVTFNCLMRPCIGLGDVLNLLDKTENDALLQETVALGPVYSIIRAGDDSFVPILLDAILSHSRFELSTRGDRKDSEFPRGRQLAELLAEREGKA